MRKRLLKLLPVLVLVIATPSAAWCQTVLAENTQSDEGPISVAADGKRKINLSGRQRMLSQYMAKALCFAGLGIDESVQINDLRATHYLFDQTLIDLRNGSKVQRLLPEKDADILAALDVVDKDWKLYGSAVLRRDLNVVNELNLTVLKNANEAVTKFERKYGSLGTLKPEIAVALNISGRQRMLTQKASKELCLMASGQAIDTNRQNLAATIALFERLMKGLRDGDQTLGLQPAAAGEIIDQIDRASIEWTQLKTALEQGAATASPSKDNLMTVARLNVKVLESVNKIVTLYEVLGE